jgi:hypothetical protein
MVAVIAVPTYNSATPKLGGFPFYYWYQLLWVVITGVLMVAGYWAIKLDEGKRRAARAAAGAAPAAAGPGGGAPSAEPARPAPPEDDDAPDARQEGDA